MVVYRISNCQYVADLSGKGAALYGGRWNSKDTYMVYAAESAALALLETVVHIGHIPEKGFCMIALELPANSIEHLPESKLPDGWRKSPAPDVLKKIGDAFITTGKKLALSVPSVVMPEEHNLLINPHHADFKKIKVVRQRTIPIDERLLFATGK